LNQAGENRGLAGIASTEAKTPSFRAERSEDPESRIPVIRTFWIPACAGMTVLPGFRSYASAIRDWPGTLCRVYCLSISSLGGDLASTWVAKPEVHAEVQDTS
jgi:hypothetical protein